jgi:hypothetical protein
MSPSANRTFRLSFSAGNVACAIAVLPVYHAGEGPQKGNTGARPAILDIADTWA